MTRDYDLVGLTKAASIRDGYPGVSEEGIERLSREEFNRMTRGKAPAKAPAKVQSKTPAITSSTKHIAPAKTQSTPAKTQSTPAKTQSTPAKTQSTPAKGPNALARLAAGVRHATASRNGYAFARTNNK